MEPQVMVKSFSKKSMERFDQNKFQLALKRDIEWYFPT